MKIRRMAAIALAFLMVFALIPFASNAEGTEAPARTEAAPETRLSELAEYLNYRTTYLEYTNGSPGFEKKTGTYSDGSSYKYIQSTNKGTASSTAKITSETFFMEYYETLTFQYWYDTEANYDCFRFFVNGTETLKESGSSNGWKTYTFTCTERKNYTFEWQYTKDGSNNSGEDCVRLSFVDFSRHSDEAVERAALGAEGVGDAFVYTTGAYPFYSAESDSESHPFYVKSGNYGRASSESKLIMRVYLGSASSSSPVRLSFDYAVSSEANHDIFSVTDRVGGSTSTLLTASGTEDYTWKTVTFNITKSGEHTFTFTYKKDSSIDSGSDVACIDNIKLSNPGSEARAELSYNLLNNPNSDEQLTFNTPYGSAGFVAGCGTDESYYYFASNNRYLEGSGDSVSYIETTVTMKENDNLYFEYIVSCEKYYDEFIFLVNGEEVFTASGWQDVNWDHYLFVAPEDGTYVFRWEYMKDGTVNRGGDFARIMNVTLSYASSSRLSLQDAVSDDNEYGLTIGSPDNGNAKFFMAGYSGYGNFIMSRNKYYEGTAAQMYINTPVVPAGTTVSFEYMVSAESYDKLHVKVLNAVSDEVVKEVYFSGTDSAEWNKFECTFTAEAAYQILISYEKDNSVNKNADTAYIRNICVKKSGLLGDADGNGSIEATDALLVLRMAMGIIQTPSDTSNIDVDHNGSIEATDALLILRRAMGIISSF
ncbi:MAG: dockerin type I repeat-containing protein [Clostridiales bacterium]|nr:dockerin type I repeat-containing protein [Clostridiales bacterium]